MTAYAPRSDGPLGTALRSFASFARLIPGRELFRMPRVRGDLEIESHNEWTLCLWGLHECQRISARTGKRLKVRSVEQRISLLKGLLSHRYGFQLAGAAPRLAAMMRQLRAKDPEDGTRRKRRGLRRRHLKKLWAKRSVRGEGFQALNEWAAATTAWHVFARGGELASVRRSDLSFHTTRGRRYACVWLRPLKKKAGALQPKVPQYILEQPGEQWDTYAALRRLAGADIWGEGDDFLFRTAPGKAMSTGRFRALLKRYAAALGFDPKQFGAHSARIGGATDLASTGAASELLLQAKGRWQSDIGKIYARMTRRAHLAASDLMHNARGRDLEEIIPGFVQ